MLATKLLLTNQCPAVPPADEAATRDKRALSMVPVQNKTVIPRKIFTSLTSCPAMKLESVGLDYGEK